MVAQDMRGAHRHRIVGAHRHRIREPDPGTLEGRHKKSPLHTMVTYGWRLPNVPGQHVLNQERHPACVAAGSSGSVVRGNSYAWKAEDGMALC